MSSQQPLKRILIMTGGTGGHVFPGLALAAFLQDQGIEVHWLGTTKGIEARLVPESGIPFHVITIQGLRGKGLKAIFHAPVKIWRAISQSRRIIQMINPQVVIGLGGFVSGPGGVASWLLRRPLIIHEQNAKAGLTNQILAKVAASVLSGFPQAFRNRKKVITIGNPVRREIETLSAPKIRFDERKGPLRLLVLGGSLGAQVFNEVLPKMLSELDEKDRPCIVHQTGVNQWESTVALYQSMGLQPNDRLTIKPFIDDMKEAYAWADLVLCRAGALTVTELCAVGLGAIFIPYPYAVDDHQTANAQFMVKHQAALCVPQSEFNSAFLGKLLRPFNQSREQCLTMANAAYALRKPNVPQHIFSVISDVYEHHQAISHNAK